MLIQQQKSIGEDRQQRLGGNEVAERRFTSSLHGTWFGTRRDREELFRLVHFLFFLFFFSFALAQEKKIQTNGQIQLAVVF